MEFFFFMLFIMFIAFLIGMYRLLQQNKATALNRQANQRVETLNVELTPKQVRKIAREETDDSNWTRDYFDNFVGYVHRGGLAGSLAGSLGIGFGIRTIERPEGGTTVTLEPYARESSIAEEIVHATTPYGGLQRSLDKHSTRKAWDEIAPVRQRILSRLMERSDGTIDSEVMD